MSEQIVRLTQNELENILYCNRNGIYYTEVGVFYYVNGQPHREDGPAFEYIDGEKHWGINGNYHRLDGPAVEFNNGGKHYYINHKNYSENDYNIQIYLINNNLTFYE